MTATRATAAGPTGTRTGGWRTQIPVYSPLSAASLARACGRAWTPGADPCAELESLLVREYGADGAILTDSGTHALQLAIGFALADAPDSPTVALPAFTCYDVATAAVGADARVLLYDIDPDTLAPDTLSLEVALERGARVVVVSPLYGIPVDLDGIERLAARYGAVVIEDAAQGHGAEWRSLPLGAHGRLSVLSFGRGKGWTGGAGGAVLWRRGQLALERNIPAATAASAARTLARAAAQWAFGRPSLYAIPSSIPSLGLGETRYREPSMTTAPHALIAALALATAGAARREAATRRTHAAALLEELPQNVSRIRYPEGGSPGYLRLPVRVHGADTVAMQLRHLGVAQAYPTTLARLPAVHARLATGEDTPLPGAETLVRELVTLPTHSRLSQTDLQGLVSRFGYVLAR